MKQAKTKVLLAALTIALLGAFSASGLPVAEMPTAYTQVIESYRSAIAEHRNDADKLEEHGIPLVFAFVAEDLKLVSSLIDIDGDGSPELLIYDGERQDMLWNAYTIKDGKAVRLFIGAERDRWYLTRDDGCSYLFENEGSSSAANGVNFYYALKGGELVFVNGVIYDVPSMEKMGLGKASAGDDESETPPAWFTTTTDQRDRDEYTDLAPIAEDDALALLKKYNERRVFPEGEPIVK